MAYWIFKVSDQQVYGDAEGVLYEYDNRHSVRVQPGDQFLYLDKRDGKYRFTGAGHVDRIDSRPATEAERGRASSVRMIFKASLRDISWFEPPLDISPRSEVGQLNRVALGIPPDVNVRGWGWSISMRAIPQERFRAIQAAALQSAPMPAELTRAQMPRWADQAGLLAVTHRGDTPNSNGSPRWSRDPCGVGLKAEQIVYDFLAEGELAALGGSGLRWVSRDGETPGWDLEYCDAANQLNAAEVKGTTAVRFASVEITANEWRAAGMMGDRYWLYIVADCWSQRPQIQRIKNPVALAEAEKIRLTPAVWRLEQCVCPEFASAPCQLSGSERK